MFSKYKVFVDKLSHNLSKMNYESRFFAQLYGLSIRFGRIALGNSRTNAPISLKCADIEILKAKIMIKHVKHLNIFSQLSA